MDGQTPPCGTHRKPIAAREVVDLDVLPEGDRRALGRALHAVHRKVFAGRDGESFYEYVLAPPARRNVVELYRDAAGDLVGYCALHLYDRRSGGRAATVLWAQGGLLPAYRGQAATLRFGIRQTLREKLRHPLRRVVFIGSLVHTSSYHLLCKYFPRVYPSPGRPMPEAMRRLTLELVEGFDTPAVDPADPMVRDDGWITLEPEPAEAEARFGHLPDVAYFKHRNPGYTQGHGLLVLVPLGAYDIAVAVVRRAAVSLRRAFFGRAHG